MTTNVIQPGEGAIPGNHYVRCTPDTAYWGYLPNADAKPVLTIGSGEVVTVDTLSHEGVLEDQGRDPLAYFAAHGVRPEGVLTDAVELAASAIDHDYDADGPHVVTGPIAVTGAKAGDVLKVEVLQLALRTPYGVISNRHGLGCLPGEYPENAGVLDGACKERPELYNSVMLFTDVVQHGSGLFGVLPYAGGTKQVHFPLAPFMGVMGVAPATSEKVHSVPPGDHGGNIDVNLLNVGSALYLPVQVDQALFHVGDPHYAQGDGEVALTAMEASLRGTFRISVLTGDDAAATGLMSGPFVETADAWVPVGLDVDLNEAMRKATRAAIAFLERTQGMERSVALAYLSAAADFEVSQVVDAVKGVHCVIRKSDFQAWW
jgi:acetamidase/formamidase